MTFAAVSAVRDIGDGRFAAEISPDWTIAGKPNGGYLLAVLARAATTTGPHPHVLAASAHYVSVPEPGPAEVTVVVLRAGRSASQLRASLHQGGRLCVQALLTTGRLSASEPYWSDEPSPVDVAPLDQCVRLPGVGPSGFVVAILEQVDVRIDPADVGFVRGEPSGRGELRGWLTMPDEDFDPTSLLYAVDAFPPATFEIAPTGWVPTLELTCYVRALPAPGPVQIVHRARLIDHQRVDEVASVRDSAGRLVAQGTQLAGIRLG